MEIEGKYKVGKREQMDNMREVRGKRKKRKRKRNRGGVIKVDITEMTQREGI